MAQYKQALRDNGVELSSFICVYRWSGPDELRRQAAVKNWKRLIEVAVEMGVQVINTEFSGDPNQPEVAKKCSTARWKNCCRYSNVKVSASKSRPTRGTSAKENNETVDIVKSFRSDNVKYVYSVRTFFYDKGKGEVERCCAMPVRTCRTC